MHLVLWIFIFLFLKNFEATSCKSIQQYLFFIFFPFLTPLSFFQCTNWSLIPHFFHLLEKKKNSLDSMNPEMMEYWSALKFKAISEACHDDRQVGLSYATIDWPALIG